ncbi:hypothetical protein B0O99DRAFT_589358 [Bisporella sp. PMI_857]|nr:hypothetical protein B0O99DRAFT_589358 [Bisporella sp. PMI_857]
MTSTIGFRFPSLFSTSFTSISQTHVKLLSAVAPIALPALYLIYLKRSLSQQTTTINTFSPPEPVPASLQKTNAADTLEIFQDPSSYRITREHVVSHPITLENLKPEFRTATGTILEPQLLEKYLQTTFEAFTWTPQSILMYWMIKDPAAKRTFDAEYLKNCKFEIGDRTCGVYVVTARTKDEQGGEKAILSLSPPAGWTGPIVHGILNVGYEVDDGKVTFVNETVLWRKTGGRPTMLEGGAGRWFHGLLAGWLISKGMGIVVEQKKKIL